MEYIVFKSRDLVVVRKPAGIPSQPDNTGDESILTLAERELSAEGESSALFLVHRLDRVVGGLLVLARNKKSAATFSALAASGELGKEYFAVVEGRCDSGEMSDYLYKNAAISKSIVTEKGKYGAKLARLSYECLECVETERGIRSLVRVRLMTGRFHQIRAQFSSRSMPLVGDGKYGSSDRTVRNPALYAYGICTDREPRLAVYSMPDTDAYPWNLFTEGSYKKCLK